METGQQQDCAIAESSMTKNAQETPSATAQELSIVVEDSECLDTIERSAAGVKQITPSPLSVTAVVAKSSTWSLSEDVGGDSGVSASDDHFAWYAKELTTKSNQHHSPTVIDLCDSSSDDSEPGNNKYFPISEKIKVKEVKKVPCLKTDHSEPETSDNEHDPISGKRRAKEVKVLSRLKRIKTKPLVRPLPKFLALEQEAVLRKIEKPADRALMRLLWKIGFRYTLLAHQFEGVRAVAGLPFNFPLLFKIGDESRIASTLREKIFQFFPIEMKTRGMLLADEMGLGKTIQSIAGMVLRNEWYEAHRNGTHRTLKRLPSLVVGPNDAVLLQWEETLVKAGVGPSRIQHFKQSTRLEGDIFVLLTRYQLQTEVRALLRKVNMRNNEQPTSPLFSNAPKALLHKLKNQYQ